MFDQMTGEAIVVPEIEALILGRRKRRRRIGSGAAKGDQRCGQGEELQKEFGVYVSLQLITTDRMTPGTNHNVMKRAPSRSTYLRPTRLPSMLLENDPFPGADAEPA